MDGKRRRSYATGRPLAALGFAMALGFAGVAQAESIRVDPQTLDCDRELPVRGGFNAIKDSISTLEFENCFRVQNLAQLARTYSGRSSPEFFIDRVAASQLGQHVTTDIPVLRVVFPDRVFFDTNSARLRVEAIEAVAIIAEALRSEPPDVTVFVAGHTDSRGDSDANYNLSVARSEAVAKELAKRRDVIANVWGIGFGEDMPLVANTDEWSWGQNRRVEFLFSGIPEAVAAWLADKQLDNLCVVKAGDDADRCKKEITLRSEYQAIEFVAPPQTTILPAAGHTAIDVERERRVINPVPGRRFKINPQRRSASEAPSN